MKVSVPDSNVKKIGRPKKSETTVKRQINVYLPNMVMVEEWKNLAKQSDISLSRWVQEHVETSIQRNGEGSRYSRKDLIDRNMELEKENRNLMQENEMKSKAYEALDRELQNLRTKPFLDPAYQGFRFMNRELVKTFRERKKIGYDELLSILKVNPMEIENVKAINNLIEILVNMGILEQDLRGWRWIK